MKQYQNAEDTRPPGDVLYDTGIRRHFISIDDAEAKQFRESVVEWLMTTTRTTVRCAKGGNCHTGYDRNDRS